MLAFVNHITDKPEWTRKVHDESIVAKWRKEAMDMEWWRAGFYDGDMTEEMLDYVSRRTLANDLYLSTNSALPSCETRVCFTTTMA